jgi:hypothetical protein
MTGLLCSRIALSSHLEIVVCVIDVVLVVLEGCRRPLQLHSRQKKADDVRGNVVRERHPVVVVEDGRPELAGVGVVARGVAVDSLTLFTHLV